MQTGQSVNKTARAAGIAGVLLILLSVLWVLFRISTGTDRPGDECIAVGRPPRIRPDYGALVLPPNIAPLDFTIEEEGQGHFVRIRADQGEPIEIFGKTRRIMIPEGPWHRLLQANRGGTLNIDVFVKSRSENDAGEQIGRWTRFEAIANTIATEDIDNFIVYRRIRPAHSTWREMGIYQRDVRGFDEKAILNNDSFKHGCVNCHTFCNNRTDKMLIGIRSEPYGSSALLIDGDRVNKIGATFGYTAWHPSGRVAAFSVNRVRQVFHAAADEVRDVLDLDSLIAYYRVDDQVAGTAPPLARKDRLETYPTWSPDGKYLYFCSAPITWEDRGSIPREFGQIKYDLVRISYDVDSDNWGELETILSANETGQSVLLPRISPDGRWLLFTMCDYGCFPVYRKSSDLYLMDLEAAGQTGKYEYRRLDINSDASESWHSFSSNGRWIAFSSKRLSHTFTRTYLAYLDKQGRVHKPILLPQKDPRFYGSCLWTFSLPELIAEPVGVRKEKLGRAVRGARRIPVQMPVTMATPTTEALPAHDEPWRQGRQ